MMNVYLDDDKGRFEMIYKKYRQQMYSGAFRILNNNEDAEDAVHQAFLSIAQNFGKIKIIPDDQLPAYIAVVTRNAALSIYRRNKGAAENTVSLSAELNAKTDIFGELKYKRLLKKISELPEIYKDILYLRYVSGFSNREISAILSIPVHTIWKRNERAKKLLKIKLEEDN